MAFPLFSANDVLLTTVEIRSQPGIPLLMNTNKLPLGLPEVAQKFNFGPTIKTARECCNFL